MTPEMQASRRLERREDRGAGIMRKFEATDGQARGHAKRIEGIEATMGTTPPTGDRKAGS